MIKHLLLTTAIVLTGAFAQAEKVEVMRNDTISGSELVRIKQVVNQKLRDQGVDPEFYQLDAVTLEAKSRHGKGTATLIVGQDQSTRRVKKAANDLFYLIDEDFTYHTTHWDLAGIEGQQDEAWQMEFTGNIKVDRLYAHVSPRLERIRIPFGDRLFQGSSTLYLKERLKDMGYRPNDMKLRNVLLVAKSHAGQGTAKLAIDGKGKGEKTVRRSQNGYSFQSNRPDSYNSVRWSTKGKTKGTWQIHLNGNIKVKAVIVEVK